MTNGAVSVRMGFVKSTKLIELYCTVCQCNDSRYLEATQRLSNNCRPQFTDEELITVYLWGTMQRQFTRRAVYEYTQEHLSDWFPKLPSYQAFCRRLNWLAPAFRALCEIWQEEKRGQNAGIRDFVVDSTPIILAKQTRSNRAKVARQLCSKCYNSSRKEWYYGAKLHTFAALRKGRLPIPCSMTVSAASLCDLWCAKQVMFDTRPISNGNLYADKAYLDAGWKDTLLKENGLTLLLPRKKAKLDALRSGDCYSTAVSARRQPIESFFNWVQVKTNIQHASHIRTLSGLFFHVFANLAAAAFLLLFYY